MFRIGILGAENSHAEAFTKIFNVTEKDKYPDVKVVAIGGSFPEENKKLYDKYNLEILAEKPEDMLGKVDAVMVTSRHGDLHPVFARPFIEAGLPIFIDKPFACKKEEALEIAKLAKSKGVSVLGGSSVKFAYDVLLMKNAVKNALDNNELISGDVTAPVNMHNPYGDFYFYSSHLAEISLTTFGYNPVSVDAFKNGDNITAVVHYENFDVTNRFLEGNYNYTLTLNTAKRPIFREIDISFIFNHECEKFVNLLRTGKMDVSFKELILPVYYLNAVEKSYLTGKTCKIDCPEI